ncbi:hypothetical protein [Bacillus sp. ISL-46]|uniref:hypothetical protein n=1 Tax=Bacillus sp. ISL-46 TaxID=2819129 RepID=UPI001BE5D9A1|nr:hypothetical protein [Bacillus sp. ISL-46]MBT2722322.1 hypothetical protein [Bacillus sp. ISL-46]
MKIFVYIDETNRILQYGSVKSSSGEIEIDVSENHEVIKNPFVYKYVDGQLVKDETYQQELIELKNKPTPIEELQRQQIDLAFTLMLNGVI